MLRQKVNDWLKRSDFEMRKHLHLVKQTLMAIDLQKWRLMATDSWMHSHSVTGMHLGFDLMMQNYLVTEIKKLTHSEIVKPMVRVTQKD
jgi:hypothetical protein